MLKKTVLLIIAGLVVFLAGLTGGVFLNGKQILNQKALTQAQIDKNSVLLKMLSSRGISLSANGIVGGIVGSTIVLNNNGEALRIPIGKNTSFNFFVQPAPGKNGVAPTPYYQPVQLNSIKAGDQLNISLGFSSDNKLEAQTVYIFTTTPGAVPK